MRRNGRAVTLNPPSLAVTPVSTNVPDSSPLLQLQVLLRSLFQLDLSDLDFGVYRVLRRKRDDIEAFLNEQLPRRVTEAFSSVGGGERERLQEHLDAHVEEMRVYLGANVVRDGVVDPAFAGTPLAEKYERIVSQLKLVRASEAQQAEVFNHLYNFFARYYDAGDFMPRRRQGASREHFAVPYNGEETFFHWANRGQHYVKSGELFRDYPFVVHAGLEGDFRVRFVVRHATVAPGNTKGDTRFFFPIPAEAEWNAEDRAFILPFHYRLPTGDEQAKFGKNGKAQDVILADALPRMVNAVPEPALAAALLESPPAEEGREREPSYLMRRLRHFTRRSTSDYFVHRNLRRFLDGELEFYVKDQVLHIGDLEADLPAKLRVLRTVRRLAGELTEFLAQLEDVQRRLFEKRKLVLRTDWLVLIKDVARPLWPEVLGNPAQMDAWRDLFAIDPAKDLFNPGGELNERFLEEHPTLVVDTRHFREGDFVERLLEQFDGSLEEATGGVLIHSENYQALRLIQRLYAGRVKCIYIDPPYNTGSDDFIYKDRYQHSSWLTMMEERLRLGSFLLAPDGTLLVSLNDIESSNLNRLVKQSGLGLRDLGHFVWKTRNTDNRVLTRFSVDHEYVHVFTRPDKPILGREIDRSNFTNPDNDPRGVYTTDPLTGKANAENRPNLHYTIVNNETGDTYPPDPEFGWITDEAGFNSLVTEKKIRWPKNPGSGKPRKKRFIWEASERAPIGSLGFAVKQGEGNQDLMNVLGYKAVNFPKPVSIVRNAIDVAASRTDMIVDFFAGSGTTGQAVLALNREDGGKRTFTLVEAGEHFNSVLMVRLQRILFAPEWVDGKAYRFPTEQEVARTPRLIKVLRLESYEDALHNLSTAETEKRVEPREDAFKQAVGEDEYRIRYMARLPMEESASLLQMDRVDHPFDYTIETVGGDGPREEAVDLIETFNLVYGIRVDRRERWTNPADGRLYRTVAGRGRGDRRVLVLWRDLAGLDPAAEREWLEARLAETGPWDEVLCNGDSGTPGVHSLDPEFKRLIAEPEEGL